MIVFRTQHPSSLRNFLRQHYLHQVQGSASAVSAFSGHRNIYLNYCIRNKRNTQFRLLFLFVQQFRTSLFRLLPLSFTSLFFRPDKKESPPETLGTRSAVGEQSPQAFVVGWIGDASFCNNSRNQVMVRDVESGIVHRNSFRRHGFCIP